MYVSVWVDTQVSLWYSVPMRDGTVINIIIDHKLVAHHSSLIFHPLLSPSTYKLGLGWVPEGWG